ncbi:MAG: SDR family NAD(P)-dependent oxidoreductase, partial [Clostridia bacterium]|nr:SDR family NAD(P)-dependent oxidoreductase [Clostridia bacterium]
MMNILEKFSLKGKCAIVTGGERGIGLAIAQGFAQAGADIVVAGIDESAIEPAQKLIESEGVRYVFIKTDCTDEKQVSEMVEKALDMFGHIDVLCNNVGISKHAPAEKMPLEMWNKVINTNLTTQFIVSREVGKAMLERGYGSIVNISSMSGIIVNTPIE